MRGVIPRRAALSYGLALAVSVLAQDALARRLSGLAGIRVDVTPLRANVGDPTAILAERELLARWRVRWPVARRGPGWS